MAPGRRPRVVNGPLIKPREPGRQADLARMIIVGLLLAFPAFVYAGLQSKLHEFRRDVVGLEDRLQELVDERRRLDVQFATMSDPRRIEALAREVSGLAAPGQDQVVFLPRSPEAPVRDPLYVADTTGDANGRRRP